MFTELLPLSKSEDGGNVEAFETVIYKGANKFDMTEANPFIVQGDFTNSLALFCYGAYYYTGAYYCPGYSITYNPVHGESFFMSIGDGTYPCYRKVTLFEDRIEIAGCYDANGNELTSGYGGIMDVRLIQY